jgi:hypothetical protein
VAAGSSAGGFDKERYPKLDDFVRKGTAKGNEIVAKKLDFGMTFRPSRKQFRKFLNENGFHHEEGFLKVD